MDLFIVFENEIVLDHTNLEVLFQLFDENLYKNYSGINVGKVNGKGFDQDRLNRAGFSYE